jgi:hypothetical protein
VSTATRVEGSGPFARALAVCAKDAAAEARRRVALASVFFFARDVADSGLVRRGPRRVRAGGARGPRRRPALDPPLLLDRDGAPRSFVREEETGTALALRRVVPAVLVLAGKTLFNFLLFLAIAAVTVPASRS